MSYKFDHLARKIQPYYSKFKVSERLLFSGHSHQAWPDVAFEGQAEAFETAAELVDDKWSVAFEKTEILRQWLREFYDDPNGKYTCAPNTHDLLVKWMSSLDLKTKKRIVTTDGEFYSLFRQLRRLKEEGLEIVEVPHLPLDGFSDRLKAELTDDTAAVMISRIYFQSALINHEIPVVAQHCRDKQIPLLIDDYHGTNVIPLSLSKRDMEDVFVLIGGYKYMQWGEGNCFLRFPEHCDWRPAITGWFASFSTLTLPRDEYTVQYEGDDRFGGATYDPVSQFRAAKVIEFFREIGLSPEVLQETYKEQIWLMKKLFNDKNYDPFIIRVTHNYSFDHNAGFLSLTSPYANELWKRLKDRNVYTDCRGDILRLGPAPYIDSEQIKELFIILDQELQKILK